MTNQRSYTRTIAGILVAVVAATVLLAQVPVSSCPEPYQGNICTGSGDDRDYLLVAGGLARLRIKRDGPMQATTDGSASAPTFGWLAAPTTGFFRGGAGQFNASINGVSTLTFGQGFLSLDAAGGSLRLGGVPLLTLTAPTISSGFGSGPAPSIVSNNFTATFRINVGGGGVATSGVIGLPTANNGWNCSAIDMTANIVTRQTANATNTATLTAASAWGAQDILLIHCDEF